MTINFGDKAEILHTRKLGKIFRECIEDHIDTSLLITFDFKGVRIVTNSFADECFAKLFLKRELEEVKDKTTFINTNSSIEVVILSAIKARIYQKVNP